MLDKPAGDSSNRSLQRVKKLLDADSHKFLGLCIVLARIDADTAYPAKLSSISADLLETFKSI